MFGRVSAGNVCAHPAEDGKAQMRHKLGSAECDNRTVSDSPKSPGMTPKKLQKLSIWVPNRLRAPTDLVLKAAVQLLLPAGSVVVRTALC